MLIKNSGYIDNIIFYNDDNGYSILSINNETVIGNIGNLYNFQDNLIKYTGYHFIHRQYGRQVQLETFVVCGDDKLMHCVERTHDVNRLGKKLFAAAMFANKIINQGTECILSHFIAANYYKYSPSDVRWAMKKLGLDLGFSEEDKGSRKKKWSDFRREEEYEQWASSDHNVLEISKYASSEEVKKAYRKMAMKYHPDRNPDNIIWAEERFKRIKTAYNNLYKK